LSSRTTAWLTNGRNPDKPFFLTVWTHEPPPTDRKRPGVPAALRWYREPRRAPTSWQCHPTRPRLRQPLKTSTSRST